MDKNEPFTISIRVDGKGGFPLHGEPLRHWLEDSIRWTQRKLAGEYAPDWRLLWIGTREEYPDMIERLHQRWLRGEFAKAGVWMPDDVTKYREETSL